MKTRACISHNFVVLKHRTNQLKAAILLTRGRQAWHVYFPTTHTFQRQDFSQQAISELCGTFGILNRIQVCPPSHDEMLSLYLSLKVLNFSWIIPNLFPIGLLENSVPLLLKVYSVHALWERKGKCERREFGERLLYLMLKAKWMYSTHNVHVLNSPIEAEGTKAL